MSAETAPELDAEQEVDFARYGRAVAARWWLLALGVVVGAAVGFLVSAGGSRPYDASGVVYLGQPFAPGSASPIQNLPTQIAFAAEVVAARSTRQAVAKETGVPRSRLSGHIGAEAVASLRLGRAEQPAPLVRITATHLPARQAVRVVNAVARRLVAFFSEYVDVKLGTYNARFDRAGRELKVVNATLAFARKQQTDVLDNRTLPPAEKFLLLANLNNVLLTNEQRQATLEQQQLTLRDQIALGRKIERARVVEPAAAHRQSAPSKRTGAAVGAFVGLIIGLLAALLWDPVERRVRKDRPAP